MTLVHRHGPVDEAERRQAAAGLQLDRPDRLHRPGHGRRPLPGDDGRPRPCGPWPSSPRSALSSTSSTTPSSRRLLFLTSGSILYATGTKDLNKLGGLIRLMPVSAAVAGDRLAVDLGDAALQRVRRASGRSSPARSWPGRRPSPGPLRHRRPVHERRHAGLLRQVLRHGFHFGRARSGTSAEDRPRGPGLDAGPQTRPDGRASSRASSRPCSVGLVLAALGRSEGFLLAGWRRRLRRASVSATLLGLRLAGVRRGRRAARRPARPRPGPGPRGRCSGGRAARRRSKPRPGSAATRT